MRVAGAIARLSAAGIENASNEAEVRCGRGPALSRGALLARDGSPLAAAGRGALRDAGVWPRQREPPRAASSRCRALAFLASNSR